MVMEHGLTITNDDYEKICAILQYAKAEVADLLEEELDRAMSCRDQNFHLK